MTAEHDDDPRTEGPVTGEERAMLVGFLRWQRETLQMKCDGLDATDLARRPVEPSTLSLLGLVRHMAGVERSWFRARDVGPRCPPGYYSDDDPDGDFDGAVADAEVVADAWAAWHEEIGFADPTRCRRARPRRQGHRAVARRDVAALGADPRDRGIRAA